jgi:Ca-activated chloride channel homolog
MLVFERPALLLLLITVPVLVAARHFWPSRGGTLAFPFRVWGRAGFRGPTTATTALIVFSSIAFWTGFSLLIVAAAGPELAERERAFLTRGADIIIALDQSPTMAARDFQPDNRFEAARQVVREFISRRENDPIGLVGFGEEAALRVPPTLDYEHLLSVLEQMVVFELGDGTAIGMGIAVAALHLQSSDAPRRAIILITDGVNNAGEIQPETAAAAAESLGIELYVVGIGSGEPVDLVVTDPETGATRSGELVDGFEEEALRRITEAGRGRYFFAGSRTALASVFEAIDTVERVEERSLMVVERTPYFREAILLALALILLDFLIRRLFVREVLP